jgi:hypothetical protein
MPTKISESSLFSRGKLVQSCQDLYSTSPIDGDGGDDERGIVRCGTVGIILDGPTPERQRQYEVQFLKNIVWWVNASEIEPFLE